MRRRDFVGLVAGAAVWPLAARAQQPGKIWRIGFLTARSRADTDSSNRFVQGMRDLGYVEGKDFIVEWRAADGLYERLPGLAEDLVRLKVDVIVAQASPAVRAAQRATTTTPIVIANTGDPVAAGFVETLARPGGNTTGLSLLNIDLSAKHLEFMSLLVPKLSHVAVLGNPGSTIYPLTLKNMMATAGKMGVKVLAVVARNRDEIERGFALMADEGAQGVIVFGDAAFVTQRRHIAELAIKHQLPSISTMSEFAEAGGLITYGQNTDNNFHHAATYVDKIFKGARPGDLPLEQPTSFELLINTKTARALGLVVPQSLLVLANNLLE